MRVWDKFLKQSIVVGAMFLLTSCQSALVVDMERVGSFSVRGVSFSYPGNWVVKKNTLVEKGASGKGAGLVTVIGNDVSIVAITIFNASVAKASLSQYASTVVDVHVANERYPRDRGSFEALDYVVGEEDFAGYRNVFRYQSPGLGEWGEDFFIVSSGERVAYISFQAPVKRREALRAGFDLILGSFVLEAIK